MCETGLKICFKQTGVEISLYLRLCLLFWHEKCLKIHSNCGKIFYNAKQQRPPTFTYQQIIQTLIVSLNVVILIFT